MTESELMLDVATAHELKTAFRRNGWTEVDIAALKTGDVSGRILGVLRGTHEIRAIEGFVDLDKNPFAPSDWTVAYHRKMGIQKVELKNGELWIGGRKVMLHLDDKQTRGGMVEGYKLRDALSGQEVLNKNLLDFLLEHPKLIPESWKDKAVFFWGTIYRYSKGGRLRVQFLYWNCDRWRWLHRWLDDDWSEANPAALLAK